MKFRGIENNIFGYIPKEDINREELIELVKKAQSGDKEAKNMVARMNKGLVVNIINNSYFRNYYDMDELVGMGMLGLTRAINNFDISLGYAFSSYAGECIRKEIIRNITEQRRKFIPVISFDKPVDDNDEMTLKEILKDDFDVEELYNTKEEIEYIKSVIDKVIKNKKNREMFKMYYGIDCDRVYTQPEIGDKFGCTRANVSRVVLGNLEKVKKQIIKDHIIEDEVVKHEKRKVSSIYDILELDGFGYEEVNEIIDTLNPNEVDLLHKKYGKNLEEPMINSKLPKEQDIYIKETTIPKIKRRIELKRNAMN